MLLLVVSRVLLFALAVLGLKSLVWRAVSFAVVACLVIADIPGNLPGNGYCDYVWGISVGVVVLEAMRYLLLTRPLEEFRRESDKIPAYQLPFVQRYFWLINISHRGIGWTFKDDRHIPVDPRYHTRGAFIVSRLLMALAYYCLFDVARLYTRANPVFSTGASLASQGYILRCLNIIAFSSHPYALIYITHCLCAVIAIAINLYEPPTWPHPFGHWKDAYTIRRFWGRTWHQSCRYLLTIFGPHRHNRRPWDENPSVDPSTRGPKEPWSKSYLRLCIAFVCSTLLHVTGDAPLQFRIWEKPLPAGILATGKVYHPFVIGVSAPFFLFQPLGVLVEDAVIEVGKRMGVKTGTRTKLIGYVWVWVWMSISTVSSLDGLKDAVQIASPMPGWGGGPTIIECVVGKVLGVDLLSLVSSWFAGL
ncbi:hypothetical protein J3A83DRAFT_4206387 [Scleroderma citrinum]